MNNPITSTKIEAVIKKKKPPPKPKAKDLGGFTGELSNIQRRANAYPSKTISENCRGKNTSKLIL